MNSGGNGNEFRTTYQGRRVMITFGKHLTPRLKRVIREHVLACLPATEVFKELIGDLIQDVLGRPATRVEIQEARDLISELIAWFPEESLETGEEIRWDELNCR